MPQLLLTRSRGLAAGSRADDAADLPRICLGGRGWCRNGPRCPGQFAHALLLAVRKQTFGAWVQEIEGKNRQVGTSAPTLAVAWAGPVDLLGAVAAQPHLANLSIHDVLVEEKASFDSYGGNPRNHDLVLRGETPDGSRVVICVEAKAGEQLGATIAEQAKAVEKALLANPRSKAAERLADLVSRFCGCSVPEPRVQNLRYQLFTGWAGTLTDAAEADHAVFALHEFRTDAREEDKSAINNNELVRFAEEVFGVRIPGAEAIPWCVELPAVDGVPARLYLAHVVTDVRAKSIEMSMS